MPSPTPNGVPVATPEAVPACMVEKAYVLFLGRLHPIKNVETLVTAAARLPSDLAIVIAGDGDPGYVARLRSRGG